MDVFKLKNTPSVKCWAHTRTPVRGKLNAISDI